jgi:peptidoglycan hydrolase-like protein with peptidoglycan-binding domain
MLGDATASPAMDTMAQVPDGLGDSGGSGSPRESEEDPKKRGPEEPDASEPPVPPREAASGITRGSTVSLVQQALKKRGFYLGIIDGDAGTDTWAAIRRFREANDLPASVKIDVQLLRALGL